MTNAIFTIKALPPEKDGRAVYEAIGPTGTTYHVYMQHGRWPTEVATLARMANGGRAWRWAKDVNTGKAATVLAYVRQFIAGQTPAPVAAAPAVRPGIKPENWQTLAQTLQSFVGLWLDSAMLREFREGRPSAAAIALAADSARKVINTTHNAMQRAGASALLQTMESYGLISQSVARDPLNMAIHSARQQYQIAHAQMCRSPGTAWHFYAGVIGPVLMQDDGKTDLPIILRNVQNYSEQMAINALVRALDKA